MVYCDVPVVLAPKTTSRHGGEGAKFGGPVMLQKIGVVFPPKQANLYFFTFSTNSRLRIFSSILLGKPSRTWYFNIIIIPAGLFLGSNYFRYNPMDRTTLLYWNCTVNVNIYNIYSWFLMLDFVVGT